ncbi:glycosyltransferase family 2 protein [bacterium]|nr:glycosyltransferase family 2 protein [bacterium]
MKDLDFSVVIPAKNEVTSLPGVLETIRQIHPEAEIIVVDDGSTDGTGEMVQSLSSIVVHHRTSRGNGAAIKSGLKAASRPFVVCMDADGQHDPKDIRTLLEELEQGADLAVGARSRSGQANIWRYIANSIYNGLATWVTGHTVKDLTSGFRAMRRSVILDFVDLLPNGFSYPTTSTIAFFRGGYGVSFTPIDVSRRTGSSHIKLFKDGARFLLIIFRIASLYSPLKVFFPISITFLLGGVGYYLFTYLSSGVFTNFGALLVSTSVLVFLIGLVAEQITTLLYVTLSRKMHDND